jgi:hypothetical protein
MSAMRKGKVEFVPWWNYFSPHFKPPKKPFTDDVRGSCGTYALCYLTGMKLKEAAKLLPKHLKYWSDQRLISVLRSKGYAVLPITLNNVTGCTYSKKEVFTGMHVILSCVHVHSDTASYLVQYGGKEYHSCEIIDQVPMDLVNNPVWTSYVVWHPSWGPRTSTEKHACSRWDNLYRMAVHKAVPSPKTLLRALMRVRSEQKRRYKKMFGNVKPTKVKGPRTRAASGTR